MGLRLIFGYVVNCAGALRHLRLHAPLRSEVDAILFYFSRHMALNWGLQAHLRHAPFVHSLLVCSC